MYQKQGSLYQKREICIRNDGFCQTILAAVAGELDYADFCNSSLKFMNSAL